MRRVIGSPLLPEYKRPFEQRDFRGYFTWNDLLSERLDGSLYHACHEDELDLILENDCLALRSKWKILLPGHVSPWAANGVWCGLNNFGALGNFYGPCLLSFPVSVLSGRRFMVFLRNDGRDRVFFIQHESPLPVFSFRHKTGIKSKRRVNPAYYFDQTNREYFLKRGTIYELVLTQPLPLDGCEVHGTDHPRCIPNKCTQSDRLTSRAIVQRAGLKKARRIIRRSPEVQELLRTVPPLSMRDLLPR
jgi:hypothetical protein